MVAQIRHTLRIIKSNSRFRDVVQAAWQDFNNAKLFDTRVDNIVLITGPLSATDTNDVPWLLNQARHTTDAQEFFLKVNQAHFSSDSKRRKLEAFRGTMNLSDQDLHSFFRRFHLLMYDLGTDVGNTLSLLQSLIMQFDDVNPEFVWGRIVDLVQSWNQDAGTITLEELPGDLRASFTRKTLDVMPTKLSSSGTVQTEDSQIQTPQSPVLIAANLLGGWDTKSEADREIANSIMARYGSGS